MPNNNSQHQHQPQPSRPLYEGLQYRDLDGMVKPTLHVDEFSSKMGDDADILVISFFVRDKQAAKDLVSWFEKGYDFVLDADRSPGEIKPNRYLVYIEIRRRRSAPQHIQTLINDLSTLTEFEPSDWSMHYKGKDVPFSRDTFDSMVPLRPKAYRAAHDEDLNEMRVAAGLETKKIHSLTPELRALQAAAGI